MLDQLFGGGPGGGSPRIALAPPRRGETGYLAMRLGKVVSRSRVDTFDIVGLRALNGLSLILSYAASNKKAPERIERIWFHILLSR